MDVKESKESAPKPPKGQSGVQKKNEKIVVLRSQSNLCKNNIEESEKKYSEKFGCKVVILEPNLQMVDVIDG